MKTAEKEGVKKTKDPQSNLTTSSIDKLQNCYGIAVRENANDLAGIQMAVRYIMLHQVMQTIIILNSLQEL